MQNVISAVFFSAIFLGSVLGTFPLRRRHLPESIAGSVLALRIIGLSLAFMGVLMLMLWGLKPTILAVNNQMTLNPLRWLWWFFAAATLGAAEGFIADARRLEDLPEPPRGQLGDA